MNIAIIQFPGSNSEQESIRAVTMAGMEAIPFLWNQDRSVLVHADGYFIIGGFSYEDRSRSGIIAAMDPVMEVIRAEAAKGKPVLGICNGAQILVETGLVPGLQNGSVSMALATNRRIKDGKVIGTGFYNAWVNVAMSVPPESSAFTRHLEQGQSIRIPIAHGEGRFVVTDLLMRELRANNQTVYRYVNELGSAANEFPTNPNGSRFNLAAVTNAAGNVMAMMPHPERTEAGQPIFTSMRDYIASEVRMRTNTIDYTPPPIRIGKFEKDSQSDELVTQLIITDNEAGTVEDALKRRGIDVDVKRFQHWEVKEIGNKKIAIQDIIETGELLNTNKERVVKDVASDEKSVYLLVREKIDIAGQSKKQALQSRFDIDIGEIQHGILWKVTIRDGDLSKTIKDIIKTHILFNPYSADCSIYPVDIIKPMNAPNPQHQNIIQKNLKNCLKKTDLPLGKRIQGKVRDRYVQDDKLVLITTDRQSAFDRVLASIPFKGQVLNLTSAWWFNKTKHIIPNHVLDVPDPNVTVGKKVDVFPVEFVVRGYITGTTSTSAWTNYKNGMRDYCGNILPDGMKKNQPFVSPIVTPTTKDDVHDRLISPKEIVAEGLMSQADWDYASRKALELFSFGQAIAREHGLILVDTKYEMGKDKDGNIIIVDEMHTPDSSRYWLANSYEQRMAEGKEPENIDKEFLRLWFKDNCDPYNDKELPPAPDNLVAELSRRYIMLYEMITGEKFQFPPAGQRIEDRLRKNLKKYVVSDSVSKQEQPRQQKQSTSHGKIKAVLILGSVKDEPHAKKITDALTEHGIVFDQHVASAHKQAQKGMDLITKYANQSVIYITIAGRSNALSGFTAGNSDKPVIACPPFKDKMDMWVNIHSTLQMPSKVPVMTILEPSNVALAIKRIANL